ncbi:MAG: 1,4-alpha-glucan branching enzyme, partial [Gammaproteobacteria bacterium]|nr:1,4-alpha-glucan branching enzyme [Gammaproteobacteria bacterium]
MNEITVSDEIKKSIESLCEARLHNPQEVLGIFHENSTTIFRVLNWCAESIEVLTRSGLSSMLRIEGSPVFEWQGCGDDLDDHPRLLIDRQENTPHSHQYESYSFAPTITQDEIEIFSSGQCWHAYQFLGAHPMLIDGIAGVRFAVWAPNAERVSVISDFNNWDGRVAPMENRGKSGIWELFIPNVQAGMVYKYEIRSSHNGAVIQKADPYAQEYEYRPQTASKVSKKNTELWGDQAWMKQRR